MKRKLFYILSAIAVIALVLLYLSPLILVIINASKTKIEISSSPLAWPSDWGVLLDNIKSIIFDSRNNYFKTFMSSVIIVIFSVTFTVIFGSMCAWMIVRKKGKLSSFIYYLFIAAMIIPFQVIMFPLVSWLRTLGQEITKPLFGFAMLRSYPGIIICYVGFGMSMAVFLFCGFIKGIPREIEEAAEMDGCSKFRTFVYIIFPMLKPIITTQVILQGIGIWNDYMLPLLILGKDNELQTLTLTLRNLMTKYQVDWGLMLASTLLMMLPIVIVFLIFQKQIIKGMTEGAIKS